MIRGSLSDKYAEIHLCIATLLSFGRQRDANECLRGANYSQLATLNIKQTSKTIGDQKMNVSREETNLLENVSVRRSISWFIGTVGS